MLLLSIFACTGRRQRPLVSPPEIPPQQTGNASEAVMNSLKPGAAGGGIREGKGGPLEDEYGNDVLSADGMAAGDMPSGREAMPGKRVDGGQKVLWMSALPRGVTTYNGV